MPFNLLLLPLLGGYFLVSRTHLFAFGAAKQSGERLILTAAFVAVTLLLLARLFVVIVIHAFPITGEWWRVLGRVRVSKGPFGLRKRYSRASERDSLPIPHNDSSRAA